MIKSKYFLTVLFLITFLSQTYSQDLNLNWVSSFESSGHDFISDMSTDNNGNTYVVGQFGSDLTVNSITYSPTGLQDMFFAKITNDGSVDYFHHFIGSGDERGRGIDVDDMGNIYVFGRFNENITVGGASIPIVGSGINGFVVKFNSSYQYQWYTPFNSFTESYSGNIYPLDLVANKENGGCYVTFTWDGYISFAGSFHSPVDHDGQELGTDGGVVKISSSGNKVGFALVKHETNVTLGTILNRKSIVYGGNGEIYVWGNTEFNSEYYGDLSLGYSGTGSFWYPSYTEEFQSNDNMSNNTDNNFFLSYDWDEDYPHLNWMGRIDSETTYSEFTWSNLSVSYSNAHLLISDMPTTGAGAPESGTFFHIYNNPIDQWPTSIMDQHNVSLGSSGTLQSKHIGILDIDVSNNNQPDILRYVSGIDVIETQVGNSIYKHGDLNAYDVVATESEYQFSGKFVRSLDFNGSSVTSAGAATDVTSECALCGPDDLYTANIDFNGVITSFSNLTNTADASEKYVGSAFSGSNYIVSGYSLGQGIYGDISVGSGIWNDSDQDYNAYILSFGSGPVNTVTVLSPNGGENIEVGESYSILWETTGEISNVDIEYLTNEGSSWTTVINSTSNDGSFDWTIPNAPTTTCRIKISDNADNNIYDESDGNFTIFAPSLNFDGLQNSYDVNETVNVTWETTGTITNVDVSLSDNGGQSWSIIADEINNNNSYSWVVNPELVDNNNVQLKVASSADENINNISYSISVDPTDEPHVISVEDTPNDNGYFIDIQFTRSKFDGSQNGAEIYTVYREMEDGQWQATNSLDADGSSINLVLGTTFEIGSPTNFKISASMNEGTFESAAFNGTSMDNIAPATPSSRVFVVNGDQISLSWDPNQESDLAYYSIFGGVDQSNLDLITYTIETSIQLDFNTSWIYGIMATDHHGNESEMGIFSETVNVDDLAMFPAKYKLFQNYPNPFNPITTIRYDLQDNGLVNIAIFDMKGSAVKTLINDQQTAGYKSIQWNATDNLGQPVSAGLYLYTIQAGDFRQTKKMVLLK
jgi:hypothetical protein